MAWLLALTLAVAASTHPDAPIARVRASMQALAPGAWTPDEEEYARAIAGLDASPSEVAALVALAWAETRFAPIGSDGTPPWGLTYRRARLRAECAREAETRTEEAECARWSPSIDESAAPALASWRWWRDRRCRTPDPALVLGAWQTGRCQSSALSRRVAARMAVAARAGRPWRLAAR